MAKTALLVMELQNDFLWEQRRPKFPYDTAKLIAAVNDAVSRVQASGGDVIYLKQIFPDTPSNHIIFDFCIDGTEGAELYGGLQIVSEYCFEKNVADAFLDAAFAAFTASQGYTEIQLCGIDEAGSVAATAKGAAKTGAAVTILKDATASRFPIGKLAPLRAELKALGVRYE
jgi:nicotinamidase-related amidase